MRLELSKKELDFSSNKSKLQEYINELAKELLDKNLVKEQLEKELNNSITSTDDIAIVRNKLKNFLTRIHLETPDIQNMLLKEFVDSITYNLVNDTVGIHVVIKSNSSEPTIFDKYLYASF